MLPLACSRWHAPAGMSAAPKLTLQTDIDRGPVSREARLSLERLVRRSFSIGPWRGLDRFMAVKIVPNVWESEHFRRRIFRAHVEPSVTSGELAAAVAAAPAHDLLEIVLSDGDAIGFAAASDCGFSPVVRFAHYRAELNEEMCTRNIRYARGWPKHVRRAVPGDIEELRGMAGRIKFPGRFGVPPYTPQDGIDYYRLRVEKAVRGLFDDVCLVLVATTGIAGFLLLRFSGNGECDWSLMGIDPTFRGVGGTLGLMIAGEQFCLQAGRPRITMKSPPDNTVIRFHDFLGFKRHGGSVHLYRIADTTR